VRVYYKPFVGWIWFGAILMALGGGLAVSDRRYALAARKEREARETIKASEVPSTVAASVAE
jgi:cytochrome c-type biogenesis protein CcmF